MSFRCAYLRRAGAGAGGGEGRGADDLTLTLRTMINNMMMDNGRVITQVILTF